MHRSSLACLFSLFLFLSLSLAAFGQHIVGSPTVGDEPRGVAANPNTGFVYVANVHSGTISVLRQSTVFTTITVDTLPFVVAVNTKTNRIYAAGCNFLTGAGSTVVVIDGKTNKQIDTVPLNQSCGLGTQGIAVNSFTNRVYVSDYDDSEEVVIDGSTDQIAARVNLNSGLPVGVAVDVATNQVWVALDGPQAKIDIINGATNTLRGSVIVGNGDAFIPNLAINSTTRRVYVCSSSPSGLYVVDASSHKTIATLPFGQFTNDVGIDTLSNLIFVTDGNANTVTVVDGSTNQIVSTVQLNGSFPSGVAANPVTKLVYATDFGSNMVDVITEQ